MIAIQAVNKSTMMRPSHTDMFWGGGGAVVGVWHIFVLSAMATAKFLTCNAQPRLSVLYTMTSSPDVQPKTFRESVPRVRNQLSTYVAVLPFRHFKAVSLSVT